MANFEELSKGFISGNQAKVKEITKSLIDAGTAPLDIINQGLIAVLS